MKTSRLKMAQSLWEQLIEPIQAKRQLMEDIDQLSLSQSLSKNRNEEDDDFFNSSSVEGEINRRLDSLSEIQMENDDKNLKECDMKNEGETRQDLIQNKGTGLLNYNKQVNNFNELPEAELKVYYEHEITEENNNFESVFKQEKIKGGLKKNTNVPKFLVRIFLKYFSSHARPYKSELILKHHKKIKKGLATRSSNNYTISDVLVLLRDPAGKNDELRMLNQKIMAEIIKNTLQDQVIQNKYIKSNQISYMLAMKVFALRCRSKTLTERVKIF